MYIECPYCGKELEGASHECIEGQKARVKELEAGNERYHQALAIVKEQSEDEGLWFLAATAPEAYLQQELRRLHAALEAGGDDVA